MTETGAFGTRLRLCRQSTGLSQEVLAERAGLSVRAVRNLERGRISAPHPGSLRRLADALALEGQARAEFLGLGQRRAGSAPGITTPQGLIPPAGRATIVPGSFQPPSGSLSAASVSWRSWPACSARTVPGRRRR
jgi:transcriptional regulator with XRE-family HTH domain